MRDPGRSVDTMRELTAIGVSLSTDDVGAGDSGLPALKSFPLPAREVARLPGDSHGDRA